MIVLLCDTVESIHIQLGAVVLFAAAAMHWGHALLWVLAMSYWALLDGKLQCVIENCNIHMLFWPGLLDCDSHRSPHTHSALGLE